MEEDTNMEGSAPPPPPPPPGVHADAVPMDVDFEDCSHGSISRASLATKSVVEVTESALGGGKKCSLGTFTTDVTSATNAALALSRL
ncbi:hypothetical protein PR001_g15306 [Phytophthora rubi]|uniref:Uncharacterized protein n=3 Tax=Phytophthora TaxID=4783 RepID=A0A6A3L4G8_9STRA|nr:hypothetical protein PR001_g15306 [Phytophthora rubi]